MSDAAHTCHALNCGQRVPPLMHMCRRHWYMVPKSLRDGLWDAYFMALIATSSAAGEQ